MNAVVVAIVVAVVVVCLAILFAFALIRNHKRRRGSKLSDNHATERERFLGAEIEARGSLPQITKLTTVQPLPTNEVKQNSNDQSSKEGKSKCAYLYFTVRYDEKRSKLVVKLVKSENVPVQKSYLSKPYVEVCVMPVHAKPTYGPQGIEFKIAPEDLFRQTVHFCICRYDKFSRKTTVGDVFLSLAELSADQVDMSNEVFLKNVIETNLEIKTNEKRSAKELWRKLRDAVDSRKFVRQLKRQSFVEEVAWEKIIDGRESKAGDGEQTDSHREGLGTGRNVKETGQLGTLFFSLKFDEVRSVLLIRIMKAMNIPDDTGQPPNVMVECAVISGAQPEQEPFTTSVQAKTFTPVFEEVFEFKTDYGELWKKKIHFLVWYVDADSQLNSLGKVVYSLSDLDIKGLDISETAMLFSEDIVLLDKTKGVSSDDDLSRVLFCLTYLPATKRLVVLVLKAGDLKPADDCRGIYIEVTVFHKNLRYRKATAFKTGNNNPIFNETLLFDLKDVVINDVRLQVTAYQKSAMGSNIPFAKCNLGKEVGGSEESHWLEALTAAKPIAQWHYLKPIKYVKPLVQRISTMTTKKLHSSFGLPKPSR